MEDIGEIVEVESDLQERGVVRKVVEGDIGGLAYTEEYVGYVLDIM